MIRVTVSLLHYYEIISTICYDFESNIQKRVDIVWFYWGGVYSIVRYFEDGLRGRRGRYRMVVGFTTTYICKSVPVTTKVVRSNPDYGEVYSIQHNLIKIVSDLRQVGCFLVFPQRYNWNIVEWSSTMFIIMVPIVKSKSRWSLPQDLVSYD